MPEDYKQNLANYILHLLNRMASKYSLGGSVWATLTITWGTVPPLNYFKPNFLALPKSTLLPLYTLYCWNRIYQNFWKLWKLSKELAFFEHHCSLNIMQLLELSVQVSLHLRLVIRNTVMSAEYHIKANMTKINTSGIKRAERWTSCSCFILVTSYATPLKSLHLKVDRVGVSRCICVHARTWWKKELLRIRIWLLSDTMTGTHAAEKKTG